MSDDIDVEALADLLGGREDAAERILASDWLANHVAAAREAGRAEVERLRRSKAALVEKVKRLQDQIARANMEPGQDRSKAMHAYAARAEAAEERLAGLVATLARVADEWETHRPSCNLAAQELRALLPADAATALDAVREKAKAEALREAADDLARLDEIGKTRRDLISDDEWEWFATHPLRSHAPHHTGEVARGASRWLRDRAARHTPEVGA